MRKSNFYGFAFPGDQVELEVQFISDTKVYRGIGTVKGKKKITTEFEGEIVLIEEIEDVDDQKKLFQVLTRELKL